MAAVRAVFAPLPAPLLPAPLPLVPVPYAGPAVRTHTRNTAPEPKEAPHAPGRR